MEQTNLTAVTTKFSNVSKLAKAFQSIISATPENFDAVCAQEDEVIKTAISSKWYEKYHHLVENKAQQDEFIRLVREMHYWLFNTIRNEITVMIETSQRINPIVLISAINDILNLGWNRKIGLEEEFEEDLIELSIEVLEHYPNMGYDPNEDEFFGDKSAASRLCKNTGLTRNLRVKEVVVEENYRIINNLRPAL